LHAVWKARSRGRGGLEREPRLPAAADARESEKWRLRQEASQLFQFALAPDEARQLPRQARLRRCSKGRKVLLSELVQPLRLRDVLEAVLAQVADLDRPFQEIARRP